MSWSQWPATGVAPPTVVQGPVINSAPNVANPSAASSMVGSGQYTPEQWAQMQQHWQQWAQWQQQFQQWQQQYGAEYQKSINAMAQTRTPAQQPSVPYYNMATPTQPPLPIETKPPPPPDDSHGQAQQSQQQQLQQQQLQYQQQLQQIQQQVQQQPPLPHTPASGATLSSIYATTQYSQPPPMLPGNYTTAPPPPQSAPPKDQYQYAQNQQPGGQTNNQGGFDNRNDENQKFGRNQNKNSNWQSNRTQSGKGGDFGVKRPFNQQYNERGDMKRNRVENQSEGGKWQGGNQRQPRWNEQGGNQRNQRWGDSSQGGQNVDDVNNQRNQRWGNTTNQGENRQQFSARSNPDEPSEAEKKFDKQFGEWEAQFQKWKAQNVNHPDKGQYQEYEKKWVTWRAQLLERREQMRRKRLGVAGDGNKMSQTKQPCEPTTEATTPYQGDSGQPSNSIQPYSYNEGDNSYSQSGPQVIPPLMGQVSFEGSHEVAGISSSEVTDNKPLIPLEESSDSLSSKLLENKDSHELIGIAGDIPPPPPPDSEEITQTDDNSAGFLKATSGDGIPGLDLVKEGEEQTEDSESFVAEEQKKKPDLDAISRGINSILGDQNLMNMLSLVSQTQPSQTTITNSQNPTAPVASNSPKFSPDEYGANAENEELSNQCNLDEQSQSSFNVINEPENFNRLNEGENASFNCRSFNMEADNRSQGFGGSMDNRGPKNFTDFNRGADTFNRGPDKFMNPPASGNFNKPVDNINRPSDNFNQEPDNFNSSVDDFNEGTDNFNRGFDNFNREPDNFNRGSDNFNRGFDNFNRNSNNFNRGQDNFNRGMEKFGGKPNTPNKGPPSLLDMDFSMGPGNFGRGPGNFGKNPDNFGRNTDNLNRNSEFDRGWDSDNSKRSSDEFNRGGLGGFNKGGRRGPDNLGRGGPGSSNRGGPDSFNRGSSDFFNRGEQDNFNRGGSDNFNQGGQDKRGFNNFNRGGMEFDGGRPDLSNRGGDDNFQRGTDNLNRGKDNFGRGGTDKFSRGGPSRFDRGPDNFNRGGADSFNRGRDGVNFQKDRFNRGPDPQDSNNSYQGSENFCRLANDFDRGPEAFNNENLDPRETGFPGSGNKDLNNLHLGKGKDRTQVQPLLRFDPPGQWSKSNDPSSEVLVPSEQEEKDESIWKPSTVVDYEHKPLKPSEPDILLVPIHMFDYRHKLLSRIPFPQRPKWLSETVKSFPEFDISVGRQFDMQQPSRFSSKDSRERDRKFDDRRGYDDRDRKSFDNRDRTDRKAYDDRDRKLFDDKDRKAHNDKDRRPFENRDRKFHDDRDRRSFDERDRKFFDDKDRKSFSDDRKDRKPYDDRDRKSHDDRDRKSHDDRDRKRSDERDRERRSYGNRSQKDYEEAKTSDMKTPENKSEELRDIGSKKCFNSDQLEEFENAIKNKIDSLDPNKSDNKSAPGKSNVTLIEELLDSPGRLTRPQRIVIILRGPPGSGKSHLAKLIKDKEVENGGSAPRIICLDDYFMVEQDKEIDEDGKKVKVKEMVYEYEECMEASYRQSLMKSFKKTITDGYFTFIIIDNINDKVKYFGEMWSFAKQNGFQVYICEMGLDVQACTKRNIHGRSEIEIERCVASWEPTPAHHPMLDASSLLLTDNITEVEMEEVNSPQSVEANVEPSLMAPASRYDHPKPWKTSSNWMSGQNQFTPNQDRKGFGGLTWKNVRNRRK